MYGSSVGPRASVVYDFFPLPASITRSFRFPARGYFSGSHRMYPAYIFRHLLVHLLSESKQVVLFNFEGKKLSIFPLPRLNDYKNGGKCLLYCGQIVFLHRRWDLLIFVCSLRLFLQDKLISILNSGCCLLLFSNFRSRNLSNFTGAVARVSRTFPAEL